MDFKTNKPIYMQIVDFCSVKILQKEWIEDERIPSVRELGMQLQVNPNTAMRAFEYLQSENIIYMKRGMGYYLHKDAPKQVLRLQQKEFFDDILPETFRNMEILDINIDMIIEEYEKFRNKER